MHFSFVRFKLHSCFAVFALNASVPMFLLFFHSSHLAMFNSVVVVVGCIYHDPDAGNCQWHKRRLKIDLAVDFAHHPF